VLARRTIILGTILILGIVSIFSPYHSFAEEANENTGVGEFHYFRVTDPIGFVTAIETHYASDCAANWQRASGAIVLLAQLSGDQATHMIYVGYPNYAKMAEGRGLFRSCVETASMIKTINNTTDTDSYSNVILEAVTSFNSEAIQKYYVKTDITIDRGNESDYSNAFVKFVNDYSSSQMSEGDSSGSFVSNSHHGINRLLFGNENVSHYVYFGGENLDDLILNMKAMLSSQDYVNFRKSVAPSRTVHNTALMEVLRFYPIERESD
tara:strand:- start:268 stop:1065 length:798 start_codon:yes stop_codon:yes gene_type:complete